MYHGTMYNVYTMEYVRCTVPNHHSIFNMVYHGMEFIVVQHSTTRYNTVFCIAVELETNNIGILHVVTCMW